ncbi:hypothetical protein RB596_008061 [Gaeumannomyces avenae]
MLTAEKLETSCPSGGRFFVCADAPKRFLGCCTVDPCSRGGDCPKGNLTTTTFSADLFEDIPPQDCIGAPGSKSWFTCKANSPPFMGCCSDNPCQSKPPGCPASKLIPARLSDNKTNAAVFLSSSSSPSGTPTPTPPPPTPPQPAAGLHPGAIAGIVVGALLVIGLVAALLFLRRRRNRNRESRIIAEFPAKYIPAALPDMGQHQAKDVASQRSAYPGPCSPGPYSPDAVTKPRASVASTRRTSNSSGPSFPDSYVSSTTASGLLPTHQRSMRSSSGDSHGQYARVSRSDDHSPEPSPRFEPIPEGSSRYEDPDSVALPQRPPRFEDPDSVTVSQRPPRFEDPNSVALSEYHGRGERPFSERPNTDWVPYRP